MQEDAAFRNMLLRARDKLVEQFIHHPDVSLIDIGFAPNDAKEDRKTVLRIHVRARWMKSDPAKRVAFPHEVDGIPIVVMRGDFRLDIGKGSQNEKL